jgi:CheY-like chemotaxis protein
VLSELVHDLANELQVLHGWALFARGEVAAGRAAAGELERIVGLSTELGQMLRDVMETVSGQGLSPEVDFDPRERAEALLNERFRALHGLEVRLVSYLPAGVRVRGRASFWTRALGNLVGNASRHARSEIRVELGQEHAGGADWVVVRVEDDGPGVAEEDRAKIFQPLWRGVDGNTGLGLSAVKWLAMQLGGSVRYERGRELGGAGFELLVPASTVLSTPAGRDGGQEAALTGCRLLVVDDNEMVRSAVTRLLRRVGATVKEIDPLGEPEDELVERMVGALSDFVVLDLYLGDRGGVALWKRLRDEVPELAARTLFVSGAVPGDPAWAAALATGQPVLPKPFDLGQLVAAIRELESR